MFEYSLRLDVALTAICFLIIHVGYSFLYYIIGYYRLYTFILKRHLVRKQNNCRLSIVQPGN